MDADQGNYPLPMLTVSCHGSAAEIVIRKDRQMVSLAVTSILSAGRTASDDLVANTTNFLQEGEIEAAMHDIIDWVYSESD